MLAQPSLFSLVGEPVCSGSQTNEMIHVVFLTTNVDRYVSYNVLVRIVLSISLVKTTTHYFNLETSQI